LLRRAQAAASEHNMPGLHPPRLARLLLNLNGFNALFGRAALQSRHWALQTHDQISGAFDPIDVGWNDASVRGQEPSLDAQSIARCRLLVAAEIEATTAVEEAGCLRMPLGGLRVGKRPSRMRYPRSLRKIYRVQRNAKSTPDARRSAEACARHLG
jgi:hypothetical protein